MPPWMRINNVYVREERNDISLARANIRDIIHHFYYYSQVRGKVGHASNMVFDYPFEIHESNYMVDYTRALSISLPPIFLQRRVTLIGFRQWTASA